MAEPVLLPEDRLHARILYLNRLDLWPWWRFPRLHDAFWRLYWHDRDGAALGHGGREIPLPGRRAILVPAGCTVATRPAPGIVQWYAHVDLLGLPPLAGAELTRTPWIAPEDAALRALLDPLLAGFERMPPIAALTAAKSAFWRALHLRVAALPPAVAAALAPAQRGAGRVALALRMVADDPGQTWSVERLAALSGLSPGRFAHVFRAEVGQPPWRWIVDRRLARAAELLLHGSEDIATLAASLGFHDRRHFGKLFRQRFGIAPASYRAQARTAAHGPDLPAAAAPDAVRP